MKDTPIVRGGHGGPLIEAAIDHAMAFVARMYSCL